MQQIFLRNQDCQVLYLARYLTLCSLILRICATLWNLKFQIWDLSDPYGKGYLDRVGFFTALKLVALAQNGLEIGMASIAIETPPPKMVY